MTGGDAVLSRLPQDLASKEALIELVKQAKAALEEGERINLTDPEARLMKVRAGHMVEYSGQAMVFPLDKETAGTTGMLIAAAEVTDDPDDLAQLVPMMEQAAATTGEAG